MFKINTTMTILTKAIPIRPKTGSLLLDIHNLFPNCKPIMDQCI